MKKILLGALIVVLGLFQLLVDNAGPAAEAPVTAQVSVQQQALYKTLERIRNQGPFPYERDGIVFENRERLLPIKPRGYYREYTVDTPGLSHRGPRRVVTGGNPPVVFYYTEDHYRSFIVIEGH